MKIFDLTVIRLIINITISSNEIGLKNPLFSTNFPHNMLSDSLLLDNSIYQSQLKLHFKWTNRKLQYNHGITILFIEE